MDVLELENKLKKLDIKTTGRALADVLGMNEQSFSRKRKQGSSIKFEDIKKIEEKFGISLTSANDNLINLEPLCASCGGGYVVSGNLIPNFENNSKYGVVVACGNSMYPTIADGSICVVKNYEGERIKDGAIYFFSFGDDTFIKRLAKNINEIMITSDNKEYPPIIVKGDELEKIKIYGEVVKNMRDF